jgi:hypothetical protein
LLSAAIELLRQLRGAEVDQAAVLDWVVLAAVDEPQPVDGALSWIDDQHLVDVVGGVEGELLPGLVSGRNDLDDQRRGWVPRAGAAGAVQGAVGDTEVVFAIAEIGLADQLQAGRIDVRPQETHQPHFD